MTFPSANARTALAENEKDCDITMGAGCDPDDRLQGGILLESAAGALLGYSHAEQSGKLARAVVPLVDLESLRKAFPSSFARAAQASQKPRTRKPGTRWPE